MIERAKTILLLVGWVLVLILAWIGRQPPEKQIEYVNKIDRQVETVVQTVTKTEIKKSDGTTIAIEKTQGIIQKEVARKQTSLASAQAQPKHSLGLSFKPDLSSTSFKPHEVTYGYRLTGHLWTTLSVNRDREMLFGVRFDH